MSPAADTGHAVPVPASPPAEAGVQAEPRKRTRSESRKKKTKPRRAAVDDRPRELDLDAALPPGTAAR
jgi:hypothetical protein